MKRRTSQLTIMIGVLIMIAILIFIGSFLYHKHKDNIQHINQSQLEQYSKKHHGKTIGDSHADVKLVVFQDLQCPDCRKFHDKIIKPLEHDIDNGSINVTYLNYPMINQASHQFAYMTDIIQHENSTEDYEAFIEEAYHHQNIKNPKQIVMHVPSITNQKDLFKQFDTVKNKKYQNNSQKELHIKGTPTVFLNGDLKKHYLNIKPEIKKKINH